MSDEQRKAVAPEYLRRQDRGEAFFDLFDDYAQVYFPRWGVAIGRAQIEKLFGDLSGTVPCLESSTIPPISTSFIRETWW